MQVKTAPVFYEKQACFYLKEPKFLINKIDYNFFLKQKIKKKIKKQYKGKAIAVIFNPELIYSIKACGRVARCKQKRSAAAPN